MTNQERIHACKRAEFTSYDVSELLEGVTPEHLLQETDNGPIVVYHYWLFQGDINVYPKAYANEYTIIIDVIQNDETATTEIVLDEATDVRKALVKKAIASFITE